jgi:aminopeptidase-like protein
MSPSAPSLSPAAGAALATADSAVDGAWMHSLARELFPARRSITGDGVRDTLGRLGREIPLDVREVPTGTPAFDWTVPREWNLHEAWIKGPDGERVLDAADSSLHVMGYSVPVRRRMSLAELSQHVFTLPERPDAIPYRTSYYDERWALCMSHNQLESLPEGEYEVCIDATLEDGSLTYAECVLPGAISDEVLISTHICHPELANDNLSGVVVATALARTLLTRARRHTFRFVFIPGTIGSITWLARNERNALRVSHGLVLSCVGDPGRPTYKRSRQGASEIDRAVVHALTSSGREYEVRDFSPYGYDERQYCSPGFNLPVGCLMRTPWGEYPEYHTSDDDLDVIQPDALEDTLGICLTAIDVVERNARYLNLSPKCEPQLGRRGLYGLIGGTTDSRQLQMAMLWVLNASDGASTLLDIAERSGLRFATVATAADALREHGLLAQAQGR